MIVYEEVEVFIQKVLQKLCSRNTFTKVAEAPVERKQASSGAGLKDIIL